MDWKRLERETLVMRPGGVQLWLYIVRLHELALPPHLVRHRQLGKYRRLWTRQQVSRN